MKSKKIIVTILMIGVFCISALPLSAFAAEEITAFVSIADKNGENVLAYEKVTVKDFDKDGILTISDALYAAHEKSYVGGAAAGYSTALGAYGLSLTKLWGEENGSSFGYYCNNASAFSLLDTVKDKDYVSAFVYTDMVSWSDQYVYFDVNTVKATEGESIKLLLMGTGFDSDWNSIVVPVEGAVITIDGKATEYKTDSEGKATITINSEKQGVISAVAEGKIIVSPICLYDTTAVPQTGEGSMYLVAGIILVCASVVAFCRKGLKKGKCKA